jgi:hypothetical protein
MVLRVIVLVAVFTTAFAPRAGAETTDCTTPVLIITDGRITQSTFPAMTPGNATTFWFGIYAQAEHSYSVEFVPRLTTTRTRHECNSRLSASSVRATHCRLATGRRVSP